MRLSKAVADFIGLARVSRVATVDRQGRPHVVPVCHVVASGELYFASGSESKKIRNLRSGRPWVAVAVDDYTEAWPGLKGVMVVGEAKLLDRGSRFRSVRRLLYTKYPQYEREAAIEEGESVIVAIHPRQIVSWGF